MNRIEESKPGIPRPGFQGIWLMDRTIRTKRDIEKLSRVYVIGTVPHVKQGKAVLTPEPAGPEQEAFRQISTNLLFFFSKPGQKVIGVQSVRTGEGKSFISASLACCLASQGKKVLLVEMNLRRPALAALAGVSKEAGLRSCLKGRAFDECIRETAHGFWLMPEGAAVGQELLFDGEEFRSLIDRGRQDFDYVILDNAAVSGGHEGITAGQLCDLNLFVLRSGRSRRNEIRFIHHLAAHGAIRNLAFVLNDLP